MWWSNKELELKEWEDCINSKKSTILAIIMLVSNKNLPVYKEHYIYFIDFAFGEGVTIIYSLENMKIYVSDIVESYKDTIIGYLVKLRYIIFITTHSTVMSCMLS